MIAHCCLWCWEDIAILSVDIISCLSYCLHTLIYDCLKYLQSAVRGNANSLATVTGIVDGTGSVGAAIGQVAQGVGISCNRSFTFCLLNFRLYLL